MTQKYTEADTEAFYDHEDSMYRSFWDSEGSLHWGYFDNLADARAQDFVPACHRWNESMLAWSGLTTESRVLDIGCGNGNTAIWLAQQTGCEVVGIDISAVRVGNAKALAQEYPSLRLSFQKASVTSLPFSDNSFTHVWSQATLYHVHQRELALKEIYRVLQEQGIFLFDDLITPVSEISAEGQKHVYQRLLFEPTFSYESYAKTLSEIGLMVLEAKDLSEHLNKSYQLLSELALSKYPKLSASYDKMCEAITARELGWSFYRCQKVSDRVSWIYGTNDEKTLQDKYNAWATIYDADLDETYRCSPVISAGALAKVLPNKAASILDVGAGTGMVGEALADLGYTNITAVDFSEEMLEVARKKQVYTALHQGNVAEPLTFSTPEAFDGIVVLGVFTFGHAHPKGLRNLFELLKSGGYFVLTLRVDYYESNDSLQEILEELSWSILDRVEFNIFETEPMVALVLKKH
ncbi:MAG: methyltransferase domain-containing protein [Moorea sp. SIOASIH]|uniref:methyltransferase domain-containing protein n=1 Tax=Moorena sp. SIOASIH TaxID=2607817 RepID=UPI0013BD60BD|nr:methyltransferase domain-containing protein [Moorena sp. SIOASIH]NEO42149.1 methyltransferase domain-containing protein [Moorena sp. SIOASIH]